MQIKKSKDLFVSTKELAALFGATEDELIKYCNDFINETKFQYKKIDDEEKINIIIHIIDDILSKQTKISGVSRYNDWEKGWMENLDMFCKSNYNIKKLIPEYFKKNAPVRCNYDFIKPVSCDFVYNVTNVFRIWLFKKYLEPYDNIIEFGCGTAHNLVLIASLFPEKKLFGYDWVKSSERIIKLLNEKNNYRITGGHFDFFNPNKRIKILPNSAVYTFGALEQIGSKHNKFIQFILNKKPDIIINVECLNELYDTKILTDFLALQYHKKRNYLWNYYTSLKELEERGEIEIINYHHQKFGNIYNDTHSYVIWRIINK